MRRIRSVDRLDQSSGFVGRQAVSPFSSSDYRCRCTARAGAGSWAHTFLLVDHAGRKTSQRHSTAAMVLSYDPETQEAVICSVWGQDTDWIRNIRVRPALQVQIGRESFAPEQRFLSADESFAVAVEFRRRHPGRLRVLTQVLGWDDLRSDTAVRDFVRTRPFVAFRPAPRPEPPVG